MAAPENEQETDELINKIASEIVRRKLETPAILFLEMHRPISFLGSQVLHFLTPILGTVISAKELKRLAELLESPENVERLVERIEEVAQEK